MRALFSRRNRAVCGLHDGRNTRDPLAQSWQGYQMFRHLCFALAVLCAVPASAKSLILCKAPGRRDVVMSLQDRQFRGRTLDCISGDFIADLTPCAPPGGYGLSGPTGSAPLVQVVDRWQDYGDHSGGVVGHYITADKMAFFGGSHFQGSGYKEDWSFIANRLTGTADLSEEGKPVVPFTCTKANQRF